jgi:hypothetical protein
MNYLYTYFATRVDNGQAYRRSAYVLAGTWARAKAHQVEMQYLFTCKP